MFWKLPKRALKSDLTPEAPKRAPGVGAEPRLARRRPQSRDGLCRLGKSEACWWDSSLPPSLCTYIYMQYTHMNGDTYDEIISKSKYVEREKGLEKKSGRRRERERERERDRERSRERERERARQKEGYMDTCCLVPLIMLVYGVCIRFCPGGASVHRKLNHTGYVEGL